MNKNNIKTKSIKSILSLMNKNNVKTKSTKSTKSTRSTISILSLMNKNNIKTKSTRSILSLMNKNNIKTKSTRSILSLMNKNKKMNLKNTLKILVVILSVLFFNCDGDNASLLGDGTVTGTNGLNLSGNSIINITVNDGVKDMQGTITAQSVIFRDSAIAGMSKVAVKNIIVSPGAISTVNINDSISVGISQILVTSQTGKTNNYNLTINNISNAQLQAQINVLTTQIGGLQGIITQLQNVITSASGNNTIVISGEGTLTVELQNQLNMLSGNTQMIMEQANLITLLQNEINGLSGNSETIMQQQILITQLQEQLNNISGNTIVPVDQTNAIASLTALVNRLQNDIQGIDGNSEQITNQRNTITSLQNLIAQLQTDVQSLSGNNNTIANQGNTINLLQNTITTLQNQVISLSGTATALMTQQNSNVTNLQNQINQINTTTVAQLQREINGLTTNINNVATSGNNNSLSLQSQISTLNTNINNIMTTQGNRISQLQTQLNNLSGAGLMTATVNNLQNQITQLNTTITSLQNTINEPSFRIPDNNFRMAIFNCLNTHIPNAGPYSTTTSVGRGADFNSRCFRSYPIAIANNGALIPPAALRSITIFRNGYERKTNEQKISNLTGLEHMTNLTELDLSYHNLTTINLSPLTRLNNIKLDNNSFTNISFARRTALRTISLQNNRARTVVDLSHSPNLLDVYLQNTPFSFLHYAGVNLRRLNIANTGYSGSLNVNEMSRLEYLNVAGNSGLTTIPLSATQRTKITNNQLVIICDQTQISNPRITCSDRHRQVENDNLNDAFNENPYALWSNGTTMWVLDIAASEIYAYNLQSTTRDASKDFNTTLIGSTIITGTTDTGSTGIWSDGTTMWVANNVDEKIYAYNLAAESIRSADRTRVSSKEFNTLSDAGNNDPRGLWSDGTTMWVADNDDNKIYAYNLSTKARDAAKDINTLSGAGNTEIRGLWSDGTTMWVVDRTDAKVYAYNLSSKAQVPSKDINSLGGVGNTDPAGIWSDGTTMWVTDRQDDHIYAYYLRR